MGWSLLDRRSRSWPLFLAGFLLVSGAGGISATERPGAKDRYGDDLPEGSVLRLGTIRLRHPADVTSLAFSPAGDTLASAASDGVVRLWAMPTGALIQTLASQKDYMRGVVFTPDGRSIIASSSRKIHVWDVSTGKETRVLTGPDESFPCTAVTPDGCFLASGWADHTVRLWDLASGKLMAILRGHEANVTAMAISPDGATLVSAGGSDPVRLWSLPGGKPLTVLASDGESINTLAFSSDGTLLVSAGYGGILRHWDMRDFQEVLERDDASVGQLVLLPGGRDCLTL